MDTFISSHRREKIFQRRVRKRALTLPTARECVRGFSQGGELFALSKGQFAFVDIIEAVLDITGPAHLLVSVWTASNTDLFFTNALRLKGLFLSVRWLMDFSFPRREPECCISMQEIFGDDAIRITKNHAKFAVIENEAWAVVIRTSANLNENPRLESFELSDDREMAALLYSVYDEIASIASFAQQLDNTPYQNVKDFRRLGTESPQEEEASNHLYSNDPYGVDMRRANSMDSIK